MGEGDDEDELSDSDEFLRAVANAPEVKVRAPEPHESLSRIAQFRIVEKIGRGGMGIVYRAEDEKLKRVVALKVLPGDFDDDESRKKRLLREARVAASLAHPNVAAVHEVGEADGRIYIAMELVQGTTLRRVLEAGVPSVAEALRITREIARGVARAHARGIAHRDIKPDNVMVSDDGAVKVLDFGLAKPVDVDEQKPETGTWTQEGRIVGTPGYMSPEQATGRAVDVRTDVFSIGVMLYEMLTGKRPFTGDTSMEILMATSRDEYVPVTKLAPRVPSALTDIVDRCLAKAPEERYANAGELLAALEAVDPSEARTRSRAIRLAIAAAVIASGAIVVSRVSHRPTARAEPLAPSSSATAPAATASETVPDSPSPPPALAASASAAPAVASVVVRSPVAPRKIAPSARPPIASAAPSATPAPAAPSRGGVIESSPY